MQTLRVIAVLVVLSVCVKAQTRKYVCFSKEPPGKVASPFLRTIPAEKAAPHPTEIDSKHIVLAPDFSMHDRGIVDMREFIRLPLPPSFLWRFEMCQVAD